MVLRWQLRSGKLTQRQERAGLLGGARPIGGSKRKAQRIQAGFQEKDARKRLTNTDVKTDRTDLQFCV